MLAALSPSAYSTASLTVGGTLDVQSGATAYFTGALGANAVQVDAGGAIDAAGTLTATGGGSIVNDGTIEAMADQTLGLQRLNIANGLSGTGTLIIDAGATLMLSGAVASTQTITVRREQHRPARERPLFAEHARARRAQPDAGHHQRLFLRRPAGSRRATVTSVSYDGSTLTVNLSTGGRSSFTLTPDITLTGIVPNVISGNTITFVAPTAAGVAPPSLRPHARGRCRGARVRAEHRRRDAASSHRARRPDGQRQACDGHWHGLLSADDDNGNTGVTGNNTTTLIL